MIAYAPVRSSRLTMKYFAKTETHGGGVFIAVRDNIVA